MRTIVYIDGLNLYYRMLKNRPELKWLDLVALSRAILNSSHAIVRVNYYTARVSARAHDLDAPSRQAVYLKALATLPEIAIHEGKFLVSEPWMPLATPARAKPQSYVWNSPCPDVVKVVKFEEKGSDVALGAHLVRDAFLDAFDVAMVLTNDTDLVEPIRIVVQDAKKRVGLFVPVKSPSQSLIAAASFYLHVRPGHLSASQFSDIVQLRDGSQLWKPSSWHREHTP